MQETETSDPLQHGICCFACSWKGTYGEVIAADMLHCPKCRSADLHPIGESVDLPEYHGEIGTKN